MNPEPALPGGPDTAPAGRGRRPRSLRARLVSTLALLFLCGTLVLFLGARAYGRLAADRSYDRLLAGSALSIAETLSIVRGEVRVDVPYAALDMLSAAPEDRVFYRVSGPDDRTLTGYDDLPRLAAPRTAPAPRAPSVAPDPAAAPEPVRFFDADYAGEPVRFAVLARRVAEPGLVGRIVVQVGQTRRARAGLARELVLGALAPISLITLLALSAVWVGVRRALRPLETVGAELAEREPADLRPVATPVPADLAPVVDSLNGFMRRLDANFGILRGFIAAAAHQMRTPLAALRVQAQLALDEDDPREQRAQLVAVERNASRLSRLLDQLLSDATVSHRSDLRRFERFDVVQALRRALRDVAPRADGAARVQFDSDLESAPFTGDAVMLGEALRNLVDNALRHGAAAPGALIEVRLRAEADALALTVSDRGPGLAAGDRERLFERFTRGTDTVPGAGLGLAIVRQVARSHGGEVQLLDREGGGLRAELRLPWRAP
jgi:two-component system, OmpR family, sensor histidine kinase TctE